MRVTNAFPRKYYISLKTERSSRIRWHSFSVFYQSGLICISSNDDFILFDFITTEFIISYHVSYHFLSWDICLSGFHQCCTNVCNILTILSNIFICFTVWNRSHQGNHEIGWMITWRKHSCSIYITGEQWKAKRYLRPASGYRANHMMELTQ